MAGLFSDPLGFFGGTDRQTYDPNDPDAKAAATANGSYGATRSLQGFGSQQAPTAQAASLNPGQVGQSRGQQQALYSQLGQRAAGQGPSAAAMAGQQARDASLSNANAVLAGRRGSNAAAGSLGASLAGSQGIAQANQTQAQGQANEMNQALQTQVGLGNQITGNDINVAGQNAGFQQGANLANQNSALQTNAQRLQANQQLQQQAEAEMQARLTEQGYKTQTMDPGSNGFIYDAGVAIAGGAGKAAGSAAAASDRRMKTDVRRTRSLGSAMFGGR